MVSRNPASLLKNDRTVRDCVLATTILQFLHLRLSDGFENQRWRRPLVLAAISLIDRVDEPKSDALTPMKVLHLILRSQSLFSYEMKIGLLDDGA
jgi:hypothetical protein